ncbi:unnamed protein product [Paramecium pentaurelia]|uniref:Uncharacterized protein n=1 Tax=Paramecium pentaurelia TaxID=43138 RepID=A0A8S1T4P5_9CILI|nr:unnamed protein product [Paramecium pentaurelia]
MKQLNQYQTESLTKMGRENIKNKLKCLIPNYNNQKLIVNKEKLINQSSTNTHDNSKISVLIKETNQMNLKIVSKKWLMKKRLLQQQLPILDRPQFVIKPQIILKLFVNCQTKQKH